jgi:hypothetical protein
MERSDRILVRTLAIAGLTGLPRLFPVAALRSSQSIKLEEK